jgi:N-acetylglucosaminyl-diphospho-decaprenol L-rhamnosyltransferase
MDEAVEGMTPPVSVIIVSHNTREELLQCLASLAGVSVPLEIVVVDNASADGSADAVAQLFPQVHLLRNGDNAGFGRANNQGLAVTRAPFVLLLNSDAELRPGCLETLVGLLRDRARVGIVAPRTVEADGAVQVSFGTELTPLREWRQRRLVHGVKRRQPAALKAAADAAAREHEPAWVSASCLLARREALAAVGGFDEGYFLYEEDVDLCRRVRRAGWSILFTPAAEAVHHLGRSVARDPERARFEYQRSHLRYYALHNGTVASAALRLYVGAASAAGWIASLGPGEPRARRRASRGRLLALALGRKSY